MSFLGRMFNAAFESLASVRLLFDRNENRVKERIELARNRNQTIEPRINSLQILVHKPSVPIDDIRAGTDDLVLKIKELKQKEDDMNKSHTRYAVADKVMLDTLKEELSKSVEAAKAELEEIKSESSAQKKRLEESLEAERVSNMRVDLMKEKVAEIERKKNAMQSDYEVQKARLMKDLDALKEQTNELSRANHQIGLKLAATQYAAEELMKKAPHEASPGIISAVTDTIFDRKTVSDMSHSLANMENSNGETSAAVVENFVQALPKAPESESVVSQLRGRIAKKQEDQKMTMEASGPSLRMRLEQLKTKEAKTAAATKTLSEALREK